MRGSDGELAGSEGRFLQLESGETDRLTEERVSLSEQGTGLGLVDSTWPSHAEGLELPGGGQHHGHQLLGRELPQQPT